MGDLGRRVYGLAWIALGLIGLRWDDFAAVWQPVPPETPGFNALAYAAAAVSLAAGLGLQWRRTAGPAALATAALNIVFAVLWAQRLVAAPQLYAIWLGVAEQLAIAIGGFVAWAALQPSSIRLTRPAQALFGVCLVAFGGAHFIYAKETAVMVPAWLPPSQIAWAWLTGVGHAAAGLALISGILDRLAARLATAMYIVFGALAWTPQLIAKPDDHMTWAGNAINLALVGAAWVIADAITVRARRA